MKILIIGGGGREHALAWRLSKDKRVKTIFSAPGNPGMPGFKTDVSVSDHQELLEFIEAKGIEFTIVGPEAALYEGVVDFLRANDKLVFGPTKAAAELEKDKIFSKEIMHAANIPTAESKTFGDFELALEYVTECEGDCVIKAPGPALGKGAFVCSSVEEAREALERVLVKKEFGECDVLIEEKLQGQEASFYVITDGNNIFPLPAAQDHKTIFDGDKGPMTGGMGAYAPTPAVNSKCFDEIIAKIIVPLLHTMKRRGSPYTGVIFVGLFVTAAGPKVIEFNVRFGDPETQPLMMLWEQGLLDTLMAASGEGNMLDIENKNKFYSGVGTCVVMASKGYPETSTKGSVIEGLDRIPENVTLFHAGTDKNKDGEWVTNGGRVFGVTSRGKTIQEATEAAYAAVEEIQFEGRQFRRDIGHHSL
jgi:phosphoribosylamine--glycine ligase